MPKRNVLVVFLLVWVFAFSAVSYAADATNPYASDMQVVSVIVPEVAEMTFITGNSFTMEFVWATDSWTLVAPDDVIHTLKYVTNVAGRRITLQAGIWNQNFYGSNLHLSVTPDGGSPIFITGPSKDLINPVLLTGAYQEINLTYSAFADLTVIPGIYTFQIIYTMIDN